jgi:hypothetical protein
VRFDFTVYADNANELAEALDAIQTSLPPTLFEKPTSRFRVEVSPELERGPGIIPASFSGTQFPNAPTPDEAEHAAESTPRRTRRTKAQIEADNAAAATEPRPENDDPLGLGTEPEPEPVANAQAIAPAEAKLKALDALREAYSLTGGPAAVKDLQKAYGVGKFVEVPDDKGLDLFARATALLAKLKG